jgi:hypothetical protein
VNKLAADHVLTVDEDDWLALRGDLREGRLPMHPKIVKTEPALAVHVVEICLERDHDGVHRPGFGTGLGSDTLRIASNWCGVKP